MSAPDPSGSAGRPSWRDLPASLWWRSLPLRVVATVSVASVLVLVLGGFLLMQQATSGVVEGKEDTARNQARQAVDTVQQQLNAQDLSGQVSVDKVLYDLVKPFAVPPGSTEPFAVLMVNNGQRISSSAVANSSIPDRLAVAVRQSNDLLITRTEIRYTDGRPPVPGLAAGSTIVLPGANRYEMYMLFPLTSEVATLVVLRNALVTTGVILVVLLTFIAALVARQVVTPVREARRAAENLASGNLHDRMQVRGSDDLARLATSMNDMASELEKQITTLEELSAVQQRFVSDVSHELRTPLTTVRMAAEVLHDSRGDFDPIAARSAELLQAELDRFEALLSDLLEISRFDAGAAELALGTVDLRDIIARVVEAYAPLAERNSTLVVVHAPEPATAEVDARRIERILRNLLVNAIEHSEARPIEVWVAGDEDAVAVAVRDHGVGFEAGQAKQVFHRFWRADPARARMVGGTGLGLSIALEDANLHGGWLTAWGRPGVGAQFRLTLPRTAGGILSTSPLPMVPRDYTGPTVPPDPAAEAAEERGGSGGPLAASGVEPSVLSR